MQRFFVADIHLNDNEPVITTGFLNFLTTLPANSELYILGDLFDYWIGDDITTDLQQTVANALNHLTLRHIQTYFIHGNRDFLLGKDYAKYCQMELLDEMTLLPNNGESILILHGDLLCTDDESYQRFRKKMHNRCLQKLFLCLPRYFRSKIAHKLRGKSQQYNQRKSMDIMDVNQQTVEQIAQKYHVNTIIHGHTHKPATHFFTIDDQLVKRMVLGAWHDGGNYIYQNKQGELELLFINN